LRLIWLEILNKRQGNTPLRRQFKIRADVFTVELAGVSIRSLGYKVTSPKSKHNEIITALDFLFTRILCKPCKKNERVRVG
jgi:hypothetical protein